MTTSLLTGNSSEGVIETGVAGDGVLLQTDKTMIVLSGSEGECEPSALLEVLEVDEDKDQDKDRDQVMEQDQPMEDLEDGQVVDDEDSGIHNGPQTDAGTDIELADLTSVLQAVEGTVEPAREGLFSEDRTRHESNLFNPYYEDDEKDPETAKNELTPPAEDGGVDGDVDGDVESSEDSDSAMSSSDSESSDERVGKKRMNMAHQYADDDDEEGPVASGPLRTKNELPLPPPEEVKIEIPETASIDKMGAILAVVEDMVVVQAAVSGDYQVLDEGSILCFEDRAPIGKIFDTFGPVSRPMYSIRLSASADKALYGKNKDVFVWKDAAKFVFTANIKNKGSDASNIWDEEVAEDELEFSDDEMEKDFKSVKKRDKKMKAAARNGAGETEEGAVRGGASRGRGRGRGGMSRADVDRSSITNGQGYNNVGNKTAVDNNNYYDRQPLQNSFQRPPSHTQNHYQQQPQQPQQMYCQPQGQFQYRQSQPQQPQQPLFNPFTAPSIVTSGNSYNQHQPQTPYPLANLLAHLQQQQQQQQHSQQPQHSQQQHQQQQQQQQQSAPSEFHHQPYDPTAYNVYPQHQAQYGHQQAQYSPSNSTPSPNPQNRQNMQPQASHNALLQNLFQIQQQNQQNQQPHNQNQQNPYQSSQEKWW